MLACLSNDAETEAVDFTRLEDEEAQIERILIEGLRLKQEVNRLSRILDDSESVKDELMNDNKSLKSALMDLKEREMSREAQYEDLMSRLENRGHSEEEKSVDSGKSNSSDEVEESVQESIQEVILKKRKQEREKLFSEVYYTSRSTPNTQDSEDDEANTGQKNSQESSAKREGGLSPELKNSMHQLIQDELALQSPYVISALVTEAMSSQGKKREKSNSTNTSAASSQTEATSYDSRGTSTPTKSNSSASSQTSQSSNREIALAQKLTDANTEIYSLKLVVKDMLSNIRTLEKFLQKPLLETADKD